MNEIHSYDPEMYHATLTHSVFVRLEGSVLRLSKPNRNISRRAAHNEPKPDVTFVSQKIYDLTDSRVRPPPDPPRRGRCKRSRTGRPGRGVLSVLSVCVLRLPSDQQIVTTSRRPFRFAFASVLAG